MPDLAYTAFVVLVFIAIGATCALLAELIDRYTRRM